VATFTLTGNINELTGVDASRVTMVKVTSSHRLVDPVTNVAFAQQVKVPAAAGVFAVTLPADAEPEGYYFVVDAPQIGGRWIIEAGAASSTKDLSDAVPEAMGPTDFATVSALIAAAEDAATDASEDAAAAAEAAAQAQAAAEVAVDISGIATPDALVAALVGNPASDTADELGKRHARVYTPEDYGAARDGATNDAAAFASALAAANTDGGTVHLSPGTYKVNSTIDLTDMVGVSLESTDQSVTIANVAGENYKGATILWGGADAGQVVKVVNADGVDLRGINFRVPATFTGNIIDGLDPVGGVVTQAIHVSVEKCSFTSDGTLWDSSGGTGANHIDINVGSGHTWRIRDCDFQRSHTAIYGMNQDGTPLQSTQTVLIEGCFFSALRRNAQIVNPGPNWMVCSNSIEPNYLGQACAVKIDDPTDDSMRDFNFINNWCGDVTAAGGTQIEVAGIVGLIAGNTFGVGPTATSSVIKAVGNIASMTVLGNRLATADALAKFIDWGAYGHASGRLVKLGNNNAVPLLDAGTIPNTLITDSTRSDTGMNLGNTTVQGDKTISFLDATDAIMGQIYGVGSDGTLRVFSGANKKIAMRLDGTGSDGTQSLTVEHWNGTSLVTIFSMRRTIADVGVVLQPNADNSLEFGQGNRRWRTIFTSQDVNFKEITAPSAPSANEAKLFVQDNGAGKTQLAIRFATGAVQVIATEP
jgi:hypothetical protein